MHFVYIDDSKDNVFACYSALIIPADSWRASLDRLIAARRQMKDSDGVFVRKEMHATDWNSGKGWIAPHPISKERRARLFDYFLSCVALIPGAQVINGCAAPEHEERTFERLLNRINVNMQKADSAAVIFCDQGKSYDGMLRRLRHFNPVASRLGEWEDGSQFQNIKIKRVLEDIVYRDSAKSLFIQAADACAYALLRHQNPIPSKTALGLHESFMILEPIMVKVANGKDALGIVR